MAPVALQDVSLFPASLLSCLPPSQEECSDSAGLRGVTEVCSRTWPGHLLVIGLLHIAAVSSSYDGQALFLHKTDVCCPSPSAESTPSGLDFCTG